MAVAALLSVPGVGRAQESARRATLTYERRARASRCSDEVSLRELVAARLGYEPFVEQAAIAVTVVMDGEGSALHAQIEVLDETRARRGRRNIASSDATCRELVEAVALAIALALDPRATTAAQRAPAMTAPRAPPRADVAVSSAPASVVSTPAPTPARRETMSRTPHREPRAVTATPLEIHVGAGGLVAFGTEPAVTAGGLVTVGLVGSRLSAWLEGRTNLASARLARDGTGVEAASSAASLLGCWRLGPAALCALGSLGVLSGRGRGVTAPRDDTTLHAAIGARTAVSVRVAGPLELRAFADLAFTLTPTTLRLDTQERWSTPFVAGALGAAAVMVLAP